MKSIYIMAAVAFLAVSASAQTFDRSKVREVTRRDCPTALLKDKRLVDVLLLEGGNLSSFCECLATRFAAQLDDIDYGNENAINTKWRKSRAFCLAMSIK